MQTATSVIEMFLRETIFLVQNCSFHEMIISDNTERGSLKLTRTKRKIYQQRNAEIQSCWYKLSDNVYSRTAEEKTPRFGENLVKPNLAHPFDSSSRLESSD